MLEILADGEWHTPKEMQQKTKLTIEQVAQIINFLKEYNLAKTDPKTQKIKLEENFQKLLKHEGKIKREREIAP
ncbi:MAG: hypothetical protein QXX51_07810 [Candidatus Bathyarchaeia archaeon]